MSKESKQNTAKIKKRTSTAPKAIGSRQAVILYFCFLMIFWSGALFLLAQVELKRIDSQSESFAINKTRSLLEKDITYYQWVGSQTDIYFVKTQQDSEASTPPSTDAANQRIELMQFTADALLGLSQNIWAKRTGSIIAIYTDFSQAQDPTQLDALKLIFEGSARSISGMRENNGKQYMNIMLPLEYSGSPEQGAKVTKVISLQYPMQEFTDISSKERTIVAAKYLTAWLLGMGLLFIVLVLMFANLRSWDKQIKEQSKKTDDLQSKVNLRTQDIIQLQKNLQSFMDQVPLSAYIKDKDSMFVAVNQHFADSLGCAKDKLIGTTGAGYLPPELADYFYQFEQIIFNSGDKMQMGEFEFAHNGLHFGVMFPVMGAYGQVEGVSAILSPLVYKERDGVSQSSDLVAPNSGQYNPAESYSNTNNIIPADYKEESAQLNSSSDYPLDSYQHENSPLKTEPSWDNNKDSEYDSFNSQSPLSQSDTLHTETQQSELMWGMDKKDEHSQFDVQPEHSELNTKENNISEHHWPENDESQRSENNLFNTLPVHEESSEYRSTPEQSWTMSDKPDNTEHYSSNTVSAYQEPVNDKPEQTWGVSKPSGGNLFDTLQVKEHGNEASGEQHSGGQYTTTKEPERETYAQTTMPDTAHLEEQAFTKPSFIEEPIVEQQPEILVEEPVQPSSVSLNMMLINDDVNEAQMLSESLVKLGHTVKIFDNATSGIESLVHNHFDVIFMDIQMPVMNGIQATAVIRKHERQSQSGHTPIIAMTTHASPGDKDKYKVCGMDNYVIVSSPVKELSELMEETINEFNLKN